MKKKASNITNPKGNKKSAAAAAAQKKTFRKYYLQKQLKGVVDIHPGGKVIYVPFTTAEGAEPALTISHYTAMQQKHINDLIKNHGYIITGRIL